MESIKLEYFEEKKAIITEEDFHISPEEETTLKEANPSPFTFLGINILYWSIIGAAVVIGFIIIGIY